MASKSKAPPAEEKMQFTMIPKLVNGSIAGVIGLTMCFPLDLVKTRLQSQQPGPNGELMYKSIFDCFVKTFRREGFFGMYRGYGVTVIFITPEKVLKWTANDYFRHQLSTGSGDLSVPRQMLAGGGAGLLQIIITTPMEQLKILMQDSGRKAIHTQQAGKEARRASAFMFASELIRDRGIFGMYRGIQATALRDLTFGMLYFPILAELNDLGPLRPDNSGLPVSWWTFFSGLTAAAMTALFVTPADVVKTRLQGVTKEESGGIKFNGIIDCFRKTYKMEGFKAFFKGGICRMFFIAPFFAIGQTIYILGVAEKLLGYELKKAY